jgi:hypothetical protein
LDGVETGGAPSWEQAGQAGNGEQKECDGGKDAFVQRLHTVQQITDLFRSGYASSQA